VKIPLVMMAIWYINGVEVRRLDGPQISQQPMNIINYLVSGSGWAPEPAEGNPLLTMEVDYIRVYQRDAFQGSMVCGRMVGRSPFGRSSQSSHVARPRKVTRPTTSVTVVSATPPASAGSMPKRFIS